MWISADQSNSLHVKQAAPQTSCLIHLQQGGLQRGLFIPSSSSNKAQRPAFILLLHCEGLLTPPSQSSNLHAEGWQGLSIMSQPWGDTRNQKRLCGIFIHRSNYYFFNSRWLSPPYFWSHVEVLASHLALKQVHCKHIFGGMIFMLFVAYFTHPSVWYPYSVNTGASAKNSTWVYSCTNIIQALTTTRDGLYTNPFTSF